MAEQCHVAVQDGPDVLRCELEDGHEGDHEATHPTVTAGEFTTMKCVVSWPQMYEAER